MFKLRLFGKLNLCIALCVTVFYWLLTEINRSAETQFSYIAKHHQQELLNWAKQADELLQQGDIEKLQHWKNQLSQQESTFVAISHIKLTDMVATEWENAPKDYMRLGRDIEYPIHLHHHENPLMDIPLTVNGYRFLIRLPQRMRPGAFWDEFYLASRILLPVLFALSLSYLLFRYLLSPLQKLEIAIRRYADGDFATKIYPKIARRQDEISDLAASFDHMGEKLSAAINQQRQLIQDISHELRTPLTRIQLSLDGQDSEQVVQRVSSEVSAMRRLVEATLTLAWLENEKPVLNKDNVELAPLIESIIDDAKFEFPQHQLSSQLQTVKVIQGSSHLSLSQSIENIIRNACKYTPEGKTVCIKLWQDADTTGIEVSDQGPGIAEEYLEEIFKPFFRVEQSRERGRGGFGLGLALSKRQIHACGGKIYAYNNPQGGLTMCIRLPNHHPDKTSKQE